MAVKTDIELAADSLQIQNETLSNANTAARVGTILSNVVENKINKDKIVTSLGATATDNKVPSEKCVKESLAVVLAAIPPALGFTAENAANKSTSIATDTGNNTKYPTVKAVEDKIASLGLFDYELLAATGTNSTTANIITKKYTAVERLAGNYIKLPPNPQIGDVRYVTNTGTSNDGIPLDLYVVRNATVSPQFIYETGKPSAGVGTFRLGLGSKSLFVFRYVEVDKWFVSVELGFVPDKGYKEYRGRIAQIGTNGPAQQVNFVDEITNNVALGAGDPYFRQVTFDRLSAGNYNLLIRSNENNQILLNKVDVSFSDGKIRTGASSSSVASPLQTCTFPFSSFLPGGATSDDVISFTNVYIRIYS